MHQSSFNIITRFKELVVKHYPNGIIKLLDVGSYGVNGTFKEIFSDSTRFYYVGLDVTAGPNVDYVPKDPYAWQELADDSFDVMISGQAFEHIEFPWLIIEEMHRTLKPNGLICIIAPSRGPEHKYPVDCWRYYPDGFRALAKWAGLEVLESKTFWGTTGFTDGSDQWGDTLCILHKPATADRPIRREHKRRPPSRAQNFNNPLRSGKKESYYGFARNEVLETLKKYDITPGRVLEIGCAGGATGKSVKEKLQASYYVGVELSEEAAAVARQHLDKVIVADIESVDLKADHGLHYSEFDLLIALDVLEHLYDPWDALAELARYVKDGGHIVASIPNTQNITVIRDLIKGKWKYVDAGLLDATHIRFFTLEEARKMFAGAGLAIERTDCVLNPPLDQKKITDSGNTIVDGTTSITGLTRDELLHLHTYQYIVVAKKAPVRVVGSGKASVQNKTSDQNGHVSAAPVPVWKETTPGLVSIVILAYNQQKYTQECIESIRKHTPEPHEIIFVDNGSTDGTVTWLQKLVQENDNYRLIENKENLGFAKGCNQGIEAASGEFVLLLNNDVVVTEHWLAGMLECFKSASDVGIVGPMTNSISGPQKIKSVGYTDVSGLDAFAQQFREKNRYRRVPLRRIVGFCMLFRRSLAEQIGLLDESFGSGNFEDDDYCLRAALLGHQDLIAGEVFVHHYGSRSFIGNKIDYGSSMSGNRKLFSKKWSNINAQSPLGLKLIAVKAVERAWDFRLRGQPHKAGETLLEAIRLAPAELHIHYLLAEMLIDDKQYQDALEVLKSISADHITIKGLLLTGYCLEGLGPELSDEALKCAERVLALDASSAAALNLKGLLAYKKGDREAAERHVRDAMNGDPGYGESYTNLGILLWATGQREEALGLLERGFLLAPLVSDCITAYQSAVTSSNAFARAEVAFREAKALYPHHRKIAFLLIDVLLQQKKYESAMHDVEQAMVLFGMEGGILSAALDIRNKIGPQKIDANERKKASLSLAMIVKNEEQHLARCLMSVKPLVDEMIVVDTGSGDRTKDIATAFGAKVFDFPWIDDFAKARNFSLGKAAGDWILVLDADEVVALKDHAMLMQLIRKGGKPTAYSFISRNYINQSHVVGWVANDGTYAGEEAGNGWTPSNKVRLFPRDARILFVNPVHEMVEPSLKKAGIPVKACGIPIHHYGKLNTEKDLGKGQDYYLLGRKKLEEAGEDVQAIRELAIQAGGLQKFDEAIDLWQRALKLKPDMDIAYITMVSLYLEMHEFREALTASRKALELKPEMREAICNNALCEMYAGDIDRAVESLESLILKEPGYPSAKLMLAAAQIFTGNTGKGLSMLYDLQRSGADVAAAIYPFALKLVAAGRIEYATVLLDVLADNHVLNDDLTALRAECRRLSEQAISPETL